jgi:RNA polymerase sigma-70 factor (ECF subfamily)
MDVGSQTGTFAGSFDNRSVMAPLGLATESASDAALIEASGRRPERFAVVFDRHFTAIHRYLARRAGREVADDLASQCFTIAFERRGTFDASAGGARPWLYGIATNLLRDHWRAERRSAVTMIRVGNDSAGAVHPDPAARDEADPELGRALRSLEPAQLDVLLLYAWAELSYDEIALALGVQVGTVRSRLSRARARLREELEPAAADVSDTESERIRDERRA